MRYTFMYKRFKVRGEEEDRMQIICVEIPGIHTEQIDPDHLKVMQDAYDMLNLYVPIALLNNESISLPSSQYDGRDGFFKVELTKNNADKLLK